MYPVDEIPGGRLLTPGKGPRAGYDGPQCLGPRPGGLEAWGLVLTPGRVIPAVLLCEVGDTRAKASSSRECICCRASSMEGCGSMKAGGGGAWPGEV